MFLAPGGCGFWVVFEGALAQAQPYRGVRSQRGAPLSLRPAGSPSLCTATNNRPSHTQNRRNADKPGAAELATLPVAKGDVLVMGSDGLLDNLSDADIASEVGRLKAAGARPPAVAQALAKAAYDNSVDKKKVTPYSVSATEAFDMVYSGGKPDDITVVVAFME